MVGSTFDADADAAEAVSPPTVDLKLEKAEPCDSEAPSQPASCYRDDVPESSLTQAHDPSSTLESCPSLDHILKFPTSPQDTLDFVLPLEYTATAQTAQTAADMSSPEDLAVVDDGLGHGDSDFDDMASTASSEAYSPEFNPSLRSLISRVVTPDASTEPDELSLSGDTVSNADTVSDRFDGQDDISDSVDDFTRINLDDLPLHIRGRPHETEELDQGIMMSDHTIVPSTHSAMTERLAMYETSSPASASHAVRPVMPCPAATSHNIAAFTKADQPYVMPDSPLHLLFVAGQSLNEDHQLLVVSKIMSAITGHAVILDSITKVSGSTSHSLLPLYNQQFRVTGPGADAVVVNVDHAVDYDLQRNRVEMKSGAILDLGIAELVPHIAIFFHTEQCLKHPEQARHTIEGNQALAGSLALELCCNYVALLEISAPCNDVLVPSPVLKAAIRSDPPFSFLSLRNHDGQHATSKRRQPPKVISLHNFVHDVNNDDLSRHLAECSSLHHTSTAMYESEDAGTPRSMFKTRCQMKQAFEQSPLLGSITRTIRFLFMTSLALYALSTAASKYLKSDAVSDLSARQGALAMAFNRSSVTSVDVANVLHYPTTTGVQSGSTTIGLSFPTSINVYVAKPDQLFVSLPRQYRSNAYIGLFRNDNSMVNYNATRLIGGVYQLRLNPYDAHGQVILDVQSTASPRINETVKVYLGNRLAQRATYENVARQVQQDLQRDVVDASSAARAFQDKLINNTHDALKTSALRARSLRNGVAGSVANAMQELSNSTSSLVYSVSSVMSFVVEKDRQMLSTASSLANNASTYIGSLVMKRIPAKEGLNRARVNSLRLKERLLRKPSAPLRNDAVPASLLARVKSFGCRVNQQTSHIVADTIRPGVTRLLALRHKSSKQPKSDAQPLGTGPRQKALVQRHGLKCQEQCSKNMMGDVSCSRCNKGPSHGLGEKPKCRNVGPAFEEKAIAHPERK